MKGKNWLILLELLVVLAVVGVVGSGVVGSGVAVGFWEMGYNRGVRDTRVEAVEFGVGQWAVSVNDEKPFISFCWQKYAPMPVTKMVGRAHGVDTSGFEVGQYVYMSNGQFVAMSPEPVKEKRPRGVVTEAGEQGEIIFFDER